MIRPKAHLADIFRQPPPKESRLDFLRLDKNEFLPTAHEELYREFLARLTPEHFVVHPELGPLYEKIETVLGVPRESALVTAGSDAAIRAAFEVFLEPGDEVVVLRPTFAMYEIYARVFRAKAVTVDYDENLDLAPEKIIEAIGPKTKLVALANANSPTGTALPKDGLREIVRQASKRGAAVLVDEAYYPFYPETMLPEIGEHDNLIVTRTFSKAFGLAGLRAGLAACSGSIAKLLMAQKPMYEISTLAALLAELCLDAPERAVEYAAQVRAGKNMLREFCEGRGYEVFPGECNFLHVNFGPDRERIVAGLKARRVLFKESFDHPSLKKYCRFSMGPESVAADLVRRIQSIDEEAVA